MATVTGYTAGRMQEIEDGTVVNGTIDGDNLVLVRRDGGLLTAGNVRGPQGIQGPIGEVPEAPIDTHRYVRKDGAWADLNTGLGPIDGQTYVRKNGAWVILETELAPADGKTYNMKDGAWVQQDRPWHLTLTETDALPPGWTMPGIFPSSEYTLIFSGSGYNVNFNLTFVGQGSSTTGFNYSILPTSLRPIVTSKHVAFWFESTYYSSSNGVGGIRINTNGQIQGPIFTDVNLSVPGTPVVGDGNEGHIWNADSLYPISVLVSGSYTRGTLELPPTAVYI